MVPLKIVSNVSRFKPALNLNRVLADLNHGSNSLNSISGLLNEIIALKEVRKLEKLIFSLENVNAIITKKCGKEGLFLRNHLRGSFFFLEHYTHQSPTFKSDLRYVIITLLRGCFTWKYLSLKGVYVKNEMYGRCVLWCESFVTIFSLKTQQIEVRLVAINSAFLSH